MAVRLVRNAQTICVRAANKKGFILSKTDSWLRMALLLGYKGEHDKRQARDYVVNFLCIADRVYRSPVNGAGVPTADLKTVAAKPAFQKFTGSVTSKAFLRSYEWRALRMKVLDKYGARCMCCGATPEHGVKMHVDHIKPRRKYPELALSFDNLQVLCEECNHGKGNWNERDWRPNYDASERVAAELMAHLRSL